LKEQLRKYAARLVGWSLAKGIPGAWHQFFNQAGNSESDGTASQLKQPYAQSAWVMRAIKHVSEPIAGVPLYWTAGDSEYEDDSLDAFWDSPVIGLDSWSDFVEAWVGWYKLKGEAFLIADDSWVLSVAGTIPKSKLILARPDEMKELLSGNALVGWEYRPEGQSSVRILADQVYQVKSWNPYNKWRGLGEMEAAMMAAETDYLAGKYEGNLSRNSGDQGMTVTTDGGQPSAAQIDQITTQLKRKRDRLLRGEYTDLFLNGGLKVMAPQVQGADIAFQSSRVTKRHEIFAAFGVPPSLADVKASYSFGKDSDYRALLVNTCIPTGKKLARLVTKLGQKMTGSDIDASLDWDEHPVLQEVRRERITAVQALWGMGVPLREASEYLDLELPTVAGDDVGYLPFSVAPVGDAGFNAEDYSETEPAPAPSPVEEMVKALRAGVNSIATCPACSFHFEYTAQPEIAMGSVACPNCGKPVNQSAVGKSGNGHKSHVCGDLSDIEQKGVNPKWKAKMLARRGTIKAFESKISRVLMDARRQVLGKLEAYTPEGKGITTRAVAADFMFDLADFAANFFKGMRAVSAQAVLDAGTAEWKAVGRDDPWAVPAHDVLKFVQERENKLSNVPQSIFERVQQELTDGFNEGDSRDAIAKRVRGLFNDMSTGRSKTIAQTETSAAYGYGDYQAQRGAGIQYREWLTSGLGNVRPSHQEAEGQTVRIDEDFVVGGARLQFPGDPSGPPEEIINCFCTTAAIVGDEP